MRGRKQSPETIEKRRAKMIGRRHSPETRAKLSASAINGLLEGRRQMPASRRYTKLAQKLESYLVSCGFEVEPEIRFGRYTVDLYDRKHHIAHEADGMLWHAKNEAARPGYHARRDAYLRDRFGLAVLRYSDREIVHLSVGA
jgi:very-short-patch-repair endonuclease